MTTVESNESSNRGRAFVASSKKAEGKATTNDESGIDAERHDRLATPMLWLASIRVALGIAVIPFIPWLWEQHYLLVVLARPTKEILLTGGFFVRRGDIAPITLVLVALPLLIGGVWLAYGLGLAYKQKIEDCTLTGLAGRILPPKRVKHFQRVVTEGGPKMVFLARLAVFPSTIMAAAAGSSGMAPKTFFIADGLGALTSLGIVVLAGFVLGEAYEAAGVWLTVAGAVVLAGLAILLGHYIRRR